MFRATKEQIEPLVQKHIDRYSTRLAKAKLGIPGYAMDAGHFLALWASIKAKGCDWTKFTAEERMEVRDALMDEA